MKSLQTRILLICSGIILLSGMIIGYIIYQSAYHLVLTSIGDQAKSILEYAGKSIDYEKYKGITPEAGETDYYKELRLKFNEIKETNGLRYLYTMARKADASGGFQYYYVVDGAPLDSTQYSQLGQVEEEIQNFPDIVAAFATKSPMVGDITGSEQYGMLVTAYAPIFSPTGELVGIIGGDYDASRIYSLLQTKKWQIIYTIAAIQLVSLLLLLVFARLLIAPLKQLTRQVERLRGGDFTVSFATNRQDEIGILNRAFEQMVTDLKQLIKGITQSSEQLAQASQQLSLGSEEAVRANHEIVRGIEQAAGAAAN